MQKDKMLNNVEGRKGGVYFAYVRMAIFVFHIAIDMNQKTHPILPVDKFLGKLNGYSM